MNRMVFAERVDGAARVMCGLLTLGWLALLPVTGAAESFRFAWPVPVTVGVVSEVEKDGVASTARYVIELTAAEEGELALDFREFELLTLDGRDASEPAIAAQFAPLAAVTAALPTMRLTPDGDYVGTRSLNVMLQRILALLPPDMPSSERDQLARSLRSPAMQNLIEQKSGEVWNVWVGAWNGLELEPGEELRGKAPIVIMGRELEQNILIEHLGAEAAYPGSARLRMTTLIEGPEVLALLGKLQHEIDGEAGEFRSATSRNVTEVVTRAQGLMPYSAQSDTEVIVRDAKGRAHRRRDFKAFRFEWP
ncbi:MAG: hypothetical protein WD928_18300 [Gammaproteobacteria bacterium]